MYAKLSLIAFAALTLPLAAQQQTLTCTASGPRPQFCPADTHNGVLLLREQSNGVCRQGATWVVSPRGIRVSGGCSADFMVNNGDARVGNNGYGNSPGNNGAYGNNGGYANNGAGYNGAGNNGSNGNVSGGNGGYQNNGSGNNGTGGGYANNGAGGDGDRRDGDRRDRERRAVALPAGTEVNARLEQTVRPAEIHDGDLLPMTLNTDLTVEGRVIAPRGTAVQARVSQGQNSALEMRLDSLSVNGQRYVLVSNAVHGLRDSVGGAASGQNRGGLGGFLGALEGGPEMPVGTVFNFRLVSQSVPVGN